IRGKFESRWKGATLLFGKTTVREGNGEFETRLPAVSPASKPRQVTVQVVSPYGEIREESWTLTLGERARAKPGFSGTAALGLMSMGYSQAPGSHLSGLALSI